MRSMITVERLPSSYDSYLLGLDAAKVLAAVTSISEVHVENQYIDRATLSYDWSDEQRDFERIDQVLDSKGMRRIR